MPFRGVIPAAKVAPNPFGLFSAATVVNHDGRDDHWVAGAAVETEACAFDAKLIDICNTVGDLRVMDAGDQPRYFNVLPFGIVATDTCASPGWSVQDRKARVLRQLELVTQKAVEVELWTGVYNKALDGTSGAYLSSSKAEKVNGDTAVKPLLGIALLEQALATCGVGTPGTIHATPLVTSMMGNQFLDEVDGALQTVNGNKVVSGAGYDGRGPGDASASTGADSKFVQWMYATGPTFVHLGVNELITVTEGQALNRANNDMTYVAERPALAYWDGCCHFAVRVDVRL